MLKNKEENAPSHTSNFWDAVLLGTEKPRTWKDWGDWSLLFTVCFFSKISNSRQLLSIRMGNF